MTVNQSGPLQLAVGTYCRCDKHHNPPSARKRSYLPVCQYSDAYGENSNESKPVTFGPKYSHHPTSLGKQTPLVAAPTEQGRIISHASHTQPLMATLQTIIGNDISCIAQWEVGRLSDDRPLTKFYNKFWGVSMEGEGCEWRVEGSGTARGEERMDCDNGEDGELDDGEDMREDEDVVIEEEGEDEEEEEEHKWNEEEWESEEENIDIDLIEGCYALNVDIAGIETSIWVRAEYIRLFDHIANLYYTDLSQERKQQKSSCVIVTGQPGIGALSNRVYILLFRLNEGPS
jgi:hypothetical protein